MCSLTFHFLSWKIKYAKECLLLGVVDCNPLLNKILFSTLALVLFVLGPEIVESYCGLY